MSTEGPEIPSKTRDFAEKSVDQARGAVDTLLEAARTTAESIQSTANTAELPAGQAVSRGFGYAKENIGAIFDFAQQLVRAPDLKAAAKLQSEFGREQAAKMEKQVEELRSLAPSEGDAGAKKTGSGATAGSDDAKLPENSQENLDEKLDSAVDETFPGSDPVSVKITK